MTCVIFDCDGVLVDSEAIFIHAELEFLGRHGLRYEMGDYVREFMGTPGRVWRERVLDILADTHGRQFTDEVFADLDAELKQRLPRELQAIDGARELLERIQVPMAVASSSSQDGLEWKLAHTGITSFFGTHIYSADRVARGKPAPDLFLYTAAKLGKAPAECVVVEDSSNGVIAARAAGMRTIGMTAGGHCVAEHGDRLRADGADEVVGDFAELASYLAPMLSS
ncbi:MAG: HAD family phosphatase [Pseudomonadota bacterium]